MDEKFGKSYKLCSKIVIDSLFQNGIILKEFPFYFRFLFVELQTTSSFQIIVSAPKKKFKNATDRNRIKRVIREIIRKNKKPIEEVLNKNYIQMALFISYSGNAKIEYNYAEEKILLLINRLIESIDKSKNFIHEK